MTTVAGYTLEKRVQESGGRRLFRAVRDRDGAEVLVRVFSADGAHARAEREFAALGRVASSRFAPALDLVPSGTEAIMVLGAVPGLPLRDHLKSAPLDARGWLALAEQLAEAVTMVHDQRLLHLQLTPEVVFLDPQTTNACLLDAGVGRELGYGQELRRANDADLRYTAPEQTGRMDRGCDFRSDLYSLGAVLYEALCGTPPFVADSALGLIHCHMAKLPEPPSPVRAVPPTLCRIVLKLLQKDPAARYQTAHSLAVDLAACRSQLAQGEIRDDFPLGTADAPYRPLFQKKVYGRGAEVERIRRAYEAAASPARRLLILWGPAGIGKSALPPTLAPLLAESKGHLVQGKFDLYRRERPFSAFVAAFSALAEQLLTETTEKLDVWREDFERTLGRLGPVVSELVPEMSFFVGDALPPPRARPDEARERLGLAVRRMTSVFARREHPLVIVLDDLQWADTGSLYLLESLLLSPEADSLLVIGTCRDTEVGTGHAFLGSLARLRQAGLPLDEIELGPLGEDACAEMLADALGREFDAVRALAAWIGVKTGCSPLLIQQFVGHMHEKGFVRFERGLGWTWDEAEIASADIPDDVVGLMTAKISGLGEIPRGVLCFASCVGDHFDSRALVELEVGRTLDEVDSALYELASEGLIAPSRSGFRFVHDRIREAAQGLLSEAERQRLHFRAGWRIWRSTSDEQLDERSFEILDHVNRAPELVAPEDRMAVVRLNLRAGQRALHAGAAATSRQYAAAGLAQFEPGDWSDEPDVAYELHMMDAESACLVGEYDRAETTLRDVVSRDLTDLQSARAHARWTLMYGLTREPVEALELGLAAIGRFGLSLPADPSFLRVYWASFLTWLRARRVTETTFSPPDAQSFLRFLPQQLMMGALIAPAYRHSFGLQTLISAAALRGALRFGSRGISFTLTGNAMLIAHYMGDYALAKRIAELCIHYLSAHPNQTTAHQARLSLYALILPWVADRRESLKKLEEIRDDALEAGDVAFAIYADSLNAQLAWLCGLPLPEVEAIRRAQLESFNRMGYGEWFQSVAVLRSFWELTGSELPELPEGASWDDHVLEHHRPFIAAAWMQCHLVNGRDRETFELSEAVRGVVDRVGCTMPHVSEYWLLRGVSAARMLSTREGGSRLRKRAAFRVARRRFRRWARHGPANFEHGLLWLEAERARARGDVKRAFERYEKAAHGARAIGCLPHAAMILEAQARMAIAARRESQGSRALALAQRIYADWGAARKVEQLERELTALRSGDAPC